MFDLVAKSHEFWDNVDDLNMYSYLHGIYVSNPQTLGHEAPTGLKTINPTNPLGKQSTYVHSTFHAMQCLIHVLKGHIYLKNHRSSVAF